MACENCGFVVAPGQAAQGGTCPNCERPYRMQPTPLNSEMEMRNMPAPGEEDTGGNPLQEGVLGDYQNRGVRDEAFASVQKTAEETDDGWTNWDTEQIHHWMLEHPHDEAIDNLVSQGGTPEDLRDYAVKNIVGPYNKSVMDDAQAWNSIPEPERLDPSYEELPEQGRKLVDGILGGPDVGDYDPSNNMIDPEMVNWDELHQHHTQGMNESAAWEAQKAKEEQEYGYGAGRGWSPEVMKMVNAWMPYHGAPPREEPGKLHVTTLPNGETEYTDSLGYAAAIDHLHGRQTPEQAQAMQGAMQQAGYTPQEIAEITKQRYEMLPGGKRRELYPPAPASPNKSLDEPGNTFLPSNWTASTNDPEFEITDVLVPDPESIRSDKEQMEKQADFLGDALQVAAPVAGGLVGSIVPGVGTALGAGIGAGLAGGGVAALQGGDVGDIAQTGLTDAALGGIGGGLGAGLKGMMGTAGAATMEDAAATGATKGGIGSLMKSAWGKIPTQKIQNAYMMHSLMNDAGGQMEQATTPAQNMLPQQPASPSIYSAVETPTSHDEIPSNDTDDPEEVDFHENEDKKDPKSEMDINDIGGTDLGPDDFFGAESGALAAFAELLPKVLEFALSDKSAAGDPDMEDLHQKLEAEAPGYMNSANDDDGHKLVVMMMKGGPQDEEAGDELLSDNDTSHDPISEHEATAIKPGLGNICPLCGGTIDPSSGHCPQCGAGNMLHQPQPTNPDLTNPQEMQALAAANQGPNTDQQKAAVAELLQQEGRGEEVPTMLMEPWNYADELTKITQQEEPPESIGQEGPPPAVPPSQPGEMPVPGMSAPPGGGGAGGPQMMAAINKYATSVDGFCEACPKCGSHSTGYSDYENGDAGCKTCGHKWTAPKMVKVETHVAAGEDKHADPVEPELSAVQPEQEQEQNGSLSWTDEEGSPLKVGQSYDMYSSNYDIPDRITVTAVKPDVIEYTINGEYGLSHQSELTHEEAMVEGERFVPADAEQGEPVFEENQGAQPMDPPPGQQTDLSTPHEFGLVANTHSAEAMPPNVNGTRDPVALAHEHGSGTHMTPVQGCPYCTQVDPLQQQFNAPAVQHPLGPATGKTADFNDLNAPGMGGAPQAPGPMPVEENDVTNRDAGQASKIMQFLETQGFPSEMAKSEAIRLTQELGKHEMGGVAEDIQAAPEVPHPMGPTASTGPRKVRRSEPDDPAYRMGSAPPLVQDSHEIAMGMDPREAAAQYFDDSEYQPDPAPPSGMTGPAWLMDGARTAGAHMSPWEQRSYIDESGDARNADKLQLDGTHYEMDNLSNDSFLFGL